MTILVIGNLYYISLTNKIFEVKVLFATIIGFYEVFCFAQKIFNHTKFLQPNTKLFQY